MPSKGSVLLEVLNHSPPEDHTPQIVHHAKIATGNAKVMHFSLDIMVKAVLPGMDVGLGVAIISLQLGNGITPNLSVFPATDIKKIESGVIHLMFTLVAVVKTAMLVMVTVNLPVELTQNATKKLLALLVEQQGEPVILVVNV